MEIDLAAQFRADVAALGGSPLPESNMLATVREWHPSAMAIVNGIVEEASRVFPSAGIGIAAVKQKFWPDDMISVRIGARVPPETPRKVPHFIDLEADPHAFLWQRRDYETGTIPAGGDAAAEAAFTVWLSQELATWLGRDLGLRPLGL